MIVSILIYLQSTYVNLGTKQKKQCCVIIESNEAIGDEQAFIVYAAVNAIDTTDNY